jgi:S-adenosylmethionine:tRNA ribosyltransferase-isomerase
MHEHLQLADFDYTLPDGLIAQLPIQERTHSRLLSLRQGRVGHGRFDDIATFVKPGDLLVVNNTRVLKARLFASKDSGGQAQIMLERIVSGDEALCQVRVSKALKPGRKLIVAGQSLLCVAREGEFYRLKFPTDVVHFLDAHGHMPLPPYIARGDTQMDESRYQTVYATQSGAVAAPTAGLHFSQGLLDEMQAGGVEVAKVTLHVGAGTFQPVRSEALDQHQMHHEWYEVPMATARAIRRTKAAGNSVLAVGTTVVRALESAALGNSSCVSSSGETSLFITPGFDFKIVDKLVTNFHLPKSTLLMLVSAFAGYEPVMAAYHEAVQQQYRFFSYGDAMFLERNVD